MGDYLKGRGVKSIFVTGLAGDFCVNYTATDGLELGFQSTIILNATKAINEENFKKAMEIFKTKGGNVIDSL